MAQHGLEYLDIPSHRAAYHYHHAEKILKDGNNYFLELERILKELNRAANLKPEEAKIYIALAEVYRRALDTSSAIFALRYALEKDPNNNRAKKQLCELLINRAQETMKLGTHYDRASNYFEDALEMDPTRPNIWILKAVCEIHCKNFQSALNSVNRAINISSEITIDMYILRAKILWAMGQIEAGNKDMRKVIAKNNSHPEVQAFIKRAFANAEQQYLEAYRLFNEKKSSEAIKILHNILEINQNDVKLYLLLSKSYRQLGDLDSAYQTLTNAIQIYKSIDPYGLYKNIKIPEEITQQQNIILNEMALKKAVDGEYEQAIILLNKAIAGERKLRKSPNEINYKFFLNRGDCYRAIGESLFAVADYQLALERCPENWDITTKLSLSYYNLAVESFNSSQYEECKQHIIGAILLNPKIHEYYSLKGKAEYYLGEYHEAYEDYRKCLDLNPENEEIKIRMLQFDKEMNLNDINRAHSSPASLQNSRGQNLSINGEKKFGKNNNNNNKNNNKDGLDSSLGLNQSLSSPNLSSTITTSTSVPSKVAIQLPILPSSSHSASSLPQLPSSIEVSYCTSLLPTINPYLTETMISSELLKEKKKQLKQIIHETKSSIHKKNGLWNIIDDVEVLAARNRVPLKESKSKNKLSKDKIDDNDKDNKDNNNKDDNNDKDNNNNENQLNNEKKKKLKKGEKSLPKKEPYSVTAVSLKKRSQEISKKARLNPIIKGIVPTPQLTESNLHEREELNEKSELELYSEKSSLLKLKSLSSMSLSNTQRSIKLKILDDK